MRAWKRRGIGGRGSVRRLWLSIPTTTTFARGALRAAQREAGVDRVAIEPVGRGREVHRQARTDGDQRDREQPEVPSSG